MKALTLTQPWATAIAVGVKSVETRSWSTRYRGPLAIHAAKGMDVDAFAMAAYLRDLRLLDIPVARLPRGAVVARCTLVDVVPVRHIAALTTEERLLGDYSEGRFAWILEDAEAFPEPIPARGALGLWDWTPDRG